MSTTRRNRQTGTMITTGNAAQDGWCTEGGPWYTLCEQHHTIMNHPTKTLADAWSRSPREWCEACNLCPIHRTREAGASVIDECRPCQDRRKGIA